MNIKILSDSTCDLSAELLLQHDITLIPLTVVKADEQFKDGVTITPAEIFAHVAAGGDMGSTSANSVGEYEDYFNEYAPKYDGVLLINIGSGFSSCYQNACIAAEDFDNVRVIDSQNLTTGQGHVVLEACRLAENCTDLDELAEKLRAFTEKIEASFLLDRLDYMVKGGRCSTVAALGANLLNLKPCIEVRSGKMTVVKKYRGSFAKSILSYAKDRVTGLEDLDRAEAFLTFTDVSDEILSSVRQYVKDNGNFEQIYESTAGCTISCHCGPGTLGLLLVRK